MESPYTNQSVTVFDGALEISWKPQPDRDFAFEATFDVNHPSFQQFRSGKPPFHVHPYQEEYIQVLEGTLIVEVEGVQNFLRAEDGEFLIKPWQIHCLYTVPPNESEPTTGPNIVRFLASAEKTPEVFNMDILFFENWYGYQNEVIRSGKGIDIIQAMCMFDAGGSYITFPWWVPFRRTLSLAAGIVIGRWLGGILGYQPFYQKWSTDWRLAESKMLTSPIYRHMLKRHKKNI